MRAHVGVQNFTSLVMVPKNELINLTDGLSGVEPEVGLARVDPTSP